MKRLFTFITVMLLLSTAARSAEGWPANYGGVMLQGFYWDSYEDTKWTNLTEQADELSKYFDLIWVPNSAYCSDGNSMGYDPVYWFRQSCSFGTKAELRTMIATYKAKGTGFIADVVLNHKKGLYSWIDFPNEDWTFNGTTEHITWSGADICANDDGGYTKSQGYDVTGANDTGDDFSGYRDLDHTGANVQRNCKLYQRMLLEDIGYAGLRLDMVKGYGSQYTKIYNEATNPEFCVGEYWDGYSSIVNWINGTGKTSAAFDFPLKYQLNKACGNGDWSALSDKGLAGDPNYNRYAVTFIDNHDTYENESKLTGNALAANAFILAMPGTPCIFLKHWQHYPNTIGNMILARKAAGITNQSSITKQEQSGSGYVIEVQGTKGSVLCLMGYPSYDTTGWKKIADGQNFAYFVSSNVTVNGLSDESDDDDDIVTGTTIYVEATEAPYLYAWNGAGDLNGTWPGTQMTETATVGGKTWWTKSFTVNGSINIIFNNGTSGDSNKTADITGVSGEGFFTYNGTNSYTDVTSQYRTFDTPPACVTFLEGKLHAYFRGNKDYDQPNAWVWGADNKNFCTSTEWPGDRMKKVGDDGNGHAIWLWDGGTLNENDMPTGILFSTGSGSPQSDDFTFVNGGYYDVNGQIGIATGIHTVTINSQPSTLDPSKQMYNIAGQRVGTNYKGIVIQNGQRYLRK